VTGITYKAGTCGDKPTQRSPTYGSSCCAVQRNRREIHRRGRSRGWLCPIFRARGALLVLLFALLPLACLPGPNAAASQDLRQDAGDDPPLGAARAPYRAAPSPPISRSRASVLTRRSSGCNFFYWFDAGPPIAAAQASAQFSIRNPFHPTKPRHDQLSRFRTGTSTEFRDMLAARHRRRAGPDYWGEPGQYSRRVAPAPGIELLSPQKASRPMIEALDRLSASGTPLEDRSLFSIRPS